MPDGRDDTITANNDRGLVTVPGFLNSWLKQVQGNEQEIFFRERAKINEKCFIRLAVMQTFWVYFVHHD